MAFSYSLARLREILGPSARAEGDFDGLITGVASLARAGAGDLSFLGNSKYRREADASEASVILVPEDYASAPKPGQCLIRLANPSLGLALICRDMEARLFPAADAGIHPSAVVHESAAVSPQASVGPFVSVGEGAIVGACELREHVSIGRFARVGDASVLFPKVSVGDYCEIGARNRISAGAVIGGDGFGYEYDDGAHRRVPQIGNAVTEADVDIGANATVDRARFESTVIGAGTKIDNLVQIGHNVRVGKHCLVVALAGISGSAELGDGVVVGGQAGIAGHVSVGDGARIAGGSGVAGSLEAGAKVRGFPAEPMMLHDRIHVLQRRLPELFKRFDRFERFMKECGCSNGANDET